MTRRTVITCDQCKGPIGDWEYTYAHVPHVPHVTWEGARHSWEFCSDGCLLTWITARLNERAVRDAKSAAYGASKAAKANAS